MAQNVWLSSADGDYATAANWSLGHVPLATEDVIIPAGSPDIASGFTQSGVAIDGFFVEEGYTGTIGDEANYLSIDPDSLHFSGSGVAYIDVNAANITVDVYNSAYNAGTHAAGLFLLGSNIATLNVYKGYVGLAVFEGETSTVGTVNLMYLTSTTGESSLRVGNGVTLTTWNQTGGSGRIQCAATTVTAVAGDLRIEGSGTVTTLNAEGATVYPESNGTITTLNMEKGTTDFTRNRTARTVTTPKIWAGATLMYDPDVVTFTTKLDPQGAMSLAASAL